jgi:peptide maturation system protein (TIGR04066 family)
MRHPKLLKGFKIIGLISPCGWGFDGKDAGCVDGGENIGIKITSTFEGVFEKADTIMFTDSPIKLDQSDIYQKIKNLLAAGKNIICTIQLESTMIKKLNNIATDKNVYFRYFNQDVNKNQNEQYHKLYELKTPIVFIFGLGERTQKFEVQLFLREYIQKQGYSVSQVGSRHYCEILGFHSFPGFLRNKLLSETEKIYLFNNYIKEIERTEKSDIIIIGIPGGVVPFNKEFTNDFGITAYEVCQAITPDVAIMATYCEDYGSNFFDSLFISTQYKLGFSIDCYSLAGVVIDWNKTNQSKIFEYLTLDKEYVHRKKMNLHSTKAPLYNTLDPYELNLMCKYLIHKLSEYGKTSLI